MHKHGLAKHNARPLRLWDLVLRSLPNATLHRVAAASRACNEDCVSILLARSNVSTEAQRSEGLFLPSDALSAIHGLQYLHHQFPDILTPLHVKSLYNLVCQSPELTELMCIVPYSSRYRQDEFDIDMQLALRSSFCDILSVMARRGRSPLVVFYNGVLFTCQPRDLRTWYPAPSSTTRRRSMSFTLQNTLQVIRGEQAFQVPSFANLPSVYIRLASSTHHPSLIPSTLMLLESPYTLILDTACIYGNPVPAARLAFLLAEMTFPALTYLELRRTDVPPAVLGSFLRRHPGLTYLGLSAPAEAAQPDDSRPLIAQPLAHPGLRSVAASTLPHMLRVLASLGRSPRIHSLSFPFSRTPAARPVLRAVLHLVATLPGPVALHLTLPCDSDEPALDAEDMAMAHMLRRVVSVTLVVAFYDARGMLPWLAGIPELARVRFSPNIATSRTARAKLLESARQALPHVKDIVC